MEYTLEETGDQATVAMTGRFTFVDREPFTRLVQKLSQTPGRAWTFDLERLDFVDSAALGMFLMARDTAAANGSQLVLKGPKGHVRRVFDIAKFDTLFSVEA